MSAEAKNKRKEPFAETFQYREFPIMLDTTPKPVSFFEIAINICVKPYKEIQIIKQNEAK